MENSTKALYIVAGVLIGIMILTIALYLNSIFSTYSAATQERVDKEKIVAFNNEFLVFQDRTDITVQEVVSLKNYVYEYNKSIHYDTTATQMASLANGTNSYVDVCIRGTSILGTQDSVLLETYINDPAYTAETNPKRFKCYTISTSSETGKVYRINFTY